MSQEWFYTKDGKSKFGPYSPAELKALAKSGVLAATDMVWKQGMTRWTAASTIKGLFGRLTSTPSLVPAPVPQPTPAHAQSADDQSFACPSLDKPKRRWQQRSTAGKIGVIVGSALLGVCMLASGGVALMIIARNASPEERVPEVMASELCTEYSVNRSAPNEKYGRGKTLQITGTYSSHARGDKSAGKHADRIYVLLHGERSDRDRRLDFRHVTSVRCFFDDKHKSEVENLSPGQSITVRGSCDWDEEHTVLNIENCEIVKTEVPKLSAVQLCEECRDKSSAVHEKYSGRMVEVTGTVQRLADGPFPRGEVWIEGAAGRDKFERTSVVCAFEQRQTILEARLTGDQPVTVRGVLRISDRHFGVPGAVHIDKCAFVW